ncbi:MAG: hypothetical protein CVV21_03450 [Candidatus Goldiibacteriota bacterium HGW-Goldbacteria-1]|jgi:putative inorganic carbon (HCO3(-)) transporter|nr:MAG: hypothetical protein CVV21_03450 [Candidatus Goldiibacteriota bacterium HGW-Goldbacteria-1]
MDTRKLGGKFIELAVLSMVLLIPVIFYTRTNDVFEINKMYIFRFFTIMGAAVWLIKIIIDGGFSFVKTAFDFPVLGLLAVSLLSTVVTANLNVSLFGVYEDFEGILTVINYTVFFFLLVNFTGTDRSVKKIITLTITATVFITAYGFAQNFGIDFIRWNPETYNPGRFFSTLGNPNFLAAYLVEILPLFFILFFITKDTFKKSAVLFMLVAAVVILFLTKSRAGFLSFIVTLILVIIYTFIDSKKEKNGIFASNKYWFLGFVIIFGVTAVFSDKVQEAFRDLYTRITFIFTEGVNKTPRVYIWKSALMMFRDNPILGKGLDTFQVMFPYYRLPEYWRIEWNGTPEKTHNIFLQYLSTQGIAGFGMYMLLLAAFFKKAFNVVFGEKNTTRRYIAFGFFMMVIAYFIQGLFNYTVVAYGFMFWIALAVILIMGGINSRTSWHPLAFIKNNTVLFVWTSAFLTLALTAMLTRYWAADMYYKVGNIAAETQGIEQRSLEFYNKAVKMNPFREIYWVKYGIGFERCARAEQDTARVKHFIQQAINIHTHTLKLNDKNGYNYNNIARSYKFFGEKVDRNGYNEAVKYYDEAMKRDPNNAYFALDLATVFINSGEFERAANLCQKYSEMYPLFATPYSYLGYIHMLAGRNAKDKKQTAEFLERSRQYYEKAVEPDKLWYRDNISMSSSFSNLAIIYFNSGKVKMAEDTFNRALELWPQYREGYYNLAMLYENINNLQMAADTYKRMLSIFPKDEKAIAELEKLSGRGIR